MTNTIPNVPRELLCELRDAANEGMNATTRQHQIDHFAGLIAKADALLSDPSPAGVDGLNTDRNAAFKACPESGCDWGSFYLGWKARGEVEQAIIDGLRGEVAELEAKTRTVMGVGSGSGNLFVYGDYDSIKSAQKIVIERDQLRAELSAIKAHGNYAPASVVWIDAHHVIEGNNPSFIKDVALVSAERTSETQIPLARLSAAPAAPAADAGLIEALGYQALFDAIAAATSVYANGAVNISVQAFRESLAAHRTKGVV